MNASENNTMILFNVVLEYICYFLSTKLGYLNEYWRIEIWKKKIKTWLVIQNMQ